MKNEGLKFDIIALLRATFDEELNKIIVRKALFFSFQKFLCLSFLFWKVGKYTNQNFQPEI